MSLADPTDLMLADEKADRMVELSGASTAELRVDHLAEQLVDMTDFLMEELKVGSTVAELAVAMAG